MAEEKYVRPSWDDYFLEIMHAVGKRSTCDRGRVGCVITRDNHILVTGYSGAPRGVPDCDEAGHMMSTVTHEDGTESRHCVRTAHSEQNAIIQAARVGVSVTGGTLYCTMTPCATCAKMIVNAGIERVVCEKKYHVAKETEELFSIVGIALEYKEEIVEEYPEQ
jgi:dCMP deaminase